MLGTVIMSYVEEAIADFKANMPHHFAYPSIKSYEFTEEDMSIIKDYIDTIKGSLFDTRIFIGELARDRVNESGTGIPILSWFD